LIYSAKSKILQKGLKITITNSRGKEAKAMSSPKLKTLPSPETATPLLVLNPSAAATSFNPALLSPPYAVQEAATLAEGRSRVKSGAFKLALVVLKPELSQRWLEELAELCCAPKPMRWIALVPPSFIHHPALRAFIGHYCFDYHTLPVNMARLQVILGHAYGMINLLSEVEKTPSAPSPLVGNSPAMRKLSRHLQKIAGLEAPVLIRGESGTGKELIARAIHDYSPRPGPFEAINCAALPASLIQSELFGYEKGAFTGAHRAKIGRIEAANGGTVFLDEIGDLPPDLQVTLLRFLQEKTIERVGGTGPKPVDVRIVAATHVDLEAAIAARRFREDLYYRLKVLELNVPPLREREEDIELLARFFLAKHARELKNPKVRDFSRAARCVLRNHPWPGNVRELMNRIYQAVAMGEDPLIEPEDLGLEQRHGTRLPATLEGAREEAERRTIWNALWRSGNSVPKAAMELQVSRATLYRLLEKHGLKLEALQAQERA
jgi:DNA-binding NtrC family response regulator